MVIILPLPNTNCPLQVVWLIYRLFLNVQPAVFHLYLGREQVRWYIYNLYRNEGKGWFSGSTICDCHWNSMEGWAGRNHLVFCSGYNAHALFRNLQKRSLTCKKRETLQTRYPLFLAILLPDNPQWRGLAQRHPGMRWTALWV